MKKRSLIFLILIGILSYVSLFSIFSVRERQKIDQAISENTYSLNLEELKDSERQSAVFFEILDSARIKEINVYKFFYLYNKTPIIYIDLNQTNHQLKRQQLKLSVDFTHDEQLINRKNHYSFKPMTNYLSDVGVINGQVLLQGQEEEVQQLVSNINQQFSSQLELNPSRVTYSSMYWLFLLGILIGCCALCVLVMLYDFYDQYKAVTVMLLNGYSKAQILGQFFYGYYIKYFFIGSILSVIVSVFIKRSQRFILLLNLLYFISILIVCLGITIFLVRKYQISYEVIQEQKPLKKLLRLNNFVSGGLICFLTIFVQVYADDLGQLIKERGNKTENQELLANYTYSHLLFHSVDYENEKAVYNSFLTSNNLLNYWFDRGVLIVYLTDDTLSRLKSENYYPGYGANEVYVSPEYINKQELRDENNQIIRITNDEQVMIELVPEMYRKEETKLLAYLTENHEFLNHKVGEEYSSDEKESEGKSDDSQIEIRYIKDHQKLLELFPAQTNLSNSILRVITKNNTAKSSVYGNTILGRSSAILVKKDEIYRQGEVYEIDPLNLHKSFSKGYSADEYFKTVNQFDLQLYYPLLVTSGLALVIYLGTVVFQIVTYFQLNSRELTLKKLLGYSSKAIYFPLGIKIVTWLVCLLLINLIMRHWSLALIYLLIFCLTTVFLILTITILNKQRKNSLDDRVN